MRVSCVIPSIGRPTLDRAIESCKQQSVDCEIIISDDSEDGIDRDDVKVVDGGGGNIPRSRNNGASAASGDFIVNLDDDDRFCDDMAIEKMLDKVDDDTSLVSGWVKTQKGVSKTPDDVWPDILGTNVVGTNSGTLIPTEKYWEVGGYDEEQVYQNDHEMWIKLVSVGEVKTVNEPLVEYDLDSNNKITSDPLVYHHRRRIYYKHKDKYRNLGFFTRIDLTARFFQKQNELRFHDALTERDLISLVISGTKTALSDPRCLGRWEFWRGIAMRSFPNTYRTLEKYL